MQTFMTPIREPGFQPRQSLPIRSRVYVERANQKPLTREDGLPAKRLLLSKMLSKDFLIDIYICSTISCCQINYH